MSLNFPANKNTLLTISLCLIFSVCYTKTGCQEKRCEVDRYYQGKSGVVVKPKGRDDILQSRAVTILPIVIHVVWADMEENIPTEIILKQIDRLNLDFNNPRTSRESVPVEFRALIANPAIQFCLTRKDPNGNPHSGIIRRQTNVKNIGSTKDAFGKYLIHSSNGSPAWNPSRYINVWIGKMENIFGRSTIGGTSYPAEEDGIVIDPSQFGLDFSRDLLGRTLVHEIGHYLGLQHLWGSRSGECTEDDGINDTPLQDAPYFDCPKYPQRSCGTSNMFMNFMDFVDDLCMDLFTRGQVDRMHNILATHRSGLLIPDEDCNALTGNIMLPQINYYHHPTKKSVTLQSNLRPNAAVYIQVSNILGQSVYQNSWESVFSAEIPTKYWVTGIYLINLRYHNERRTIKLFIP